MNVDANELCSALQDNSLPYSLISAFNICKL